MRLVLEAPPLSDDPDRGAVLRQIGVDGESWRVDVSAHPFSTCMGPLDSRLTTRYEPGHPLAKAPVGSDTLTSARRFVPLS